MFEIIELGDVKTTTSKSACNHVYVVDVSGSMYGDLPKIRQHLKNIISVVAQPDDTFSVIYFSGKDQFGTVFEAVRVSDVSTITMMHNAIDRFIQPIGLTGFVQPMQKAIDLNLPAGMLNNFIMLTDGWDNQSRRSDIMSVAELLKTKFDAVTFIEYGYYADRQTLADMAEAVGGSVIFADSVEKYEAAIESVVRSVPRTPNVQVNVNKKAKHCIYQYGDTIRIVAVEDGAVSVPEDAGRIHSIVPGDVLNKQLSEDHLYMILYYAAKTGNGELVWKTLAALGDVAIMRAYENAFTKQELSLFEERCFNAVMNVEHRYVKGKDLSAIPRPNAPTIVDLLSKLAEVGAKLAIDSKHWNYKARSRARVAGEELPKFEAHPMSNVDMKGLVFNSERPNVSIQTTVDGIVHLPENSYGLNVVPSFITRNYTIIADGIRNVEKLPVLFPSEHKDKFEEFPHQKMIDTGDQCYWVFDLDETPVINRSSVNNVGIEGFVDMNSVLMETKAALKVMKHFIDEQTEVSDKIAGLVTRYGEEQAKWLSSIGIRDYGFSPVGTKSAEASDEYESVQVQVKFKGLSSLPSINAVQKKVDENKKLNVADSLIKRFIDNFEGLDIDDLKGRFKSLNASKRDIERQIASDVYALVLGRKWFGDEEQVVADATINGEKVAVTVEKVRKMIAI